MNDFVLRRSGEVLTLCARTERAKAWLSARFPESSTDRVQLKPDQARDIIGLLQFAGFGIEGAELI
jgi:hypothetical protein